MRIGGIIDISTKDIPNRASLVLFTVGCNFKCQFCHNKYLLQLNVGKKLEIDKIIFKIKNNALVNSISITGGEPTLQKDLIVLCKNIKKIGKYISIDTNGSNPEVIRNLIPYLNRVALDFKAPLKKKKLERIIGLKINPNLIIKTFNILNQCKAMEFEIRTTYIKNSLKPKDIKNIIMFLSENKFRGNFVLQQYQYSEGVGIQFKDKFQKPDHNCLLNILEPYKNLNFPFKIYLRDDVVGYCNIDEIFN